MNSKVILCYPPQRHYKGWGQNKRWLPLGIASIGAYLKKKYPLLEIVLLDLFEYSVGGAVVEISQHIDALKTNYVGFTVFTEQRFSTWEVAGQLKDLWGDKVINVVGGAHAFIMAQQIADNYDFIDIVVKGEGETAWENIIQKDICNGIMQADNIENLDTLPYPMEAFELFKNVDTKKLEAEAPIIFLRGCTDNCNFCSTTSFWKGYRSRSALNVYKEMLKYNELYGTTSFKFHDDASTGDIEQWKELCNRLITGEHNFRYEITARADHFDAELINLLEKSGCHTIAVGIESGSETIRKSMNKKLDIEKAKINMARIRESSIKLIMLMIVGYPTESDKTINETIELLREVRPDQANFMPLMILPGTKVYRDCVKWGWIDDSHWLKDAPQPYYLREQSVEKINQWMEKLHKFKEIKRVLLCAPVHEEKETFKLYLEHIRNLEVPNHIQLDKLFFLHNSEDLRELLQDDEVGVTYKNPTEYEKDENTHFWKDENFKDVVKMKNDLLHQARLGEYDYIFYVDSDLMLHRKTLKALLDADKGMVAEIFWTKWQNNNFGEMPNCWSMDQYHIDRNEFRKWRTEKGNHLVGMTGACTLIRKDVFKEPTIDWYPIYNLSFSIWEDRAFCVKVACAGHEIWINNEYPARHLYRESEVKKFIEEGGVNE